MEKTKKVLLIRPYNALIPEEHILPPHGLLIIGTVLKKKGYNVKIIDACKEKNYKKKILDEVKNAFLVGIGVWTAEVKSAYETTKFIKKNKDVPIVWGGWHSTLFPEQIIEDPLIDYVIVSEGDFSFLKLVQSLEKNKRIEKIIRNKDFVNLDKLPLIDYSLIDIEKYLYQWVSNKKRRWLPYQTSRGCPHRCAFCINPVTGNTIYRTRSVKKVLDDLEYLTKRYNLDFISFIDDNFFVNRERVKKLCEGILKRGLKFEWFAECRADYFREGHVDSDLLSLAKKVGLHTLTIGAESGSKLMLEIMKKDINVKDILNSAKLCNNFRIIPQFSFIVGIPGETKKDILMSIDLIWKLYQLCPNMVCGLGTFRPYPKCELVEKLIEKRQFREPKELKDWLKKETIELYTERIYQAPWQKNPSFLRNICDYSLIFFSYNDKEVKELIKRGIKYWPYVFFRSLAKKRIKNKFFGLPVDIFVYKLMKKIYYNARKFKNKNRV